MSSKNVVLVIDSNRTNLDLLSQQLGKEGFDTVGITSLEELDIVIQEKKDIALALIDLSGFDKFIWERCDVLHKEQIPFIVIAPQRSPITQRDSIKHGASSLLVKPIGIKELIEHINTLVGD